MTPHSRYAAVRPVAARPLTLLALCSALLLAVLIALPAPAQAHDTLLESDPADGATLETSPEAITLTFSSDILDVSPLVRISDESGEQLAEITPTVDGPVATATLTEPLPAGTYTVQWRVVSGDGHPIEGTFTTTIEQDSEAAAGPSDAGGSEDTAQGEAADAEEPQDAEAAEATSAPTAEPAAESDDGLPMPVLLGILGVIVVGAAVGVTVIVRRRD